MQKTLAAMAIIAASAFAETVTFDTYTGNCRIEYDTESGNFDVEGECLWTTENGFDFALLECTTEEVTLQVFVVKDPKFEIMPGSIREGKYDKFDFNRDITENGMQCSAKFLMEKKRGKQKPKADVHLEPRTDLKPGAKLLDLEGLTPPEE